MGRRGPYPPDHFSRVLADCEAKAALVALAAEQPSVFEEALASLAEIYAGHPDYREEWRSRVSRPGVSPATRCA